MPVPVVCGARAVGGLRAQLGELAEVAACGAVPPANPWVLVLDDLAPEEVAALEKALPDAEVRPIAVLQAPWDGFTPVPLASLCRGVISGFGMPGVRAAIETIRREA